MLTKKNILFIHPSLIHLINSEYLMCPGIVLDLINAMVNGTDVVFASMELTS